ncbi:MAG: hypothetical protein ACO2ZZ_10790 [Cyclobacteriaceae bacterium]|jgi:hypothetical protein
MNSYQIVLHAHSGFRWLALIAAVVILLKSIAGLIGNSKYQKLDNILAASFVGTMHLQFLLGLVLYFFLSPITEAAFQDFGAAMNNTDLRFWAVEHLFIMVIAIALAQVGRTLSKKAENDKSKFTKQVIFYGISLVLMIAGIPWDRVTG